MNTTAQNVQSTSLSIDGMSCGHCVQAVTKALSAVPGVAVKSVAVGSAAIETTDRSAPAKAVAALAAAGYPARAVGDSADTAATSPVQSGGGCCGGARTTATGGTPGGKTTGGCCG
jgi:copper chaperone CopZ